jgi:hypothetical protein
MKSCPKCNRTFPDETQKFCTFDGGLLISAAAQPFDPNATVRNTAADLAPPPPTQDETSRDLPDQYATIIDHAKATMTSGRNTAPTTGQTTTAFESAAKSVPVTPPAATVPPPQPPPPPPPPAAAPPELLPPASPQVAPPAAAVAPVEAAPETVIGVSPPVVAQAPKKKSKLPWIVAGLVIFLLIGGGAIAGIFLFIVKPWMDQGSISRTTNENSATNTNTNTNTTTDNTNSVAESSPSPTESVVAPPGTVEFLNSNDNLDGKLAEHYMDFSFYYPEGWAKDPKAGVPGAVNFARVERRLPPDFTQESFSVGWYTSSGTFIADLPAFPKRVEEFSSALAKVYPEYAKVSEGPTKVNSMDAYEFRWTGLSRGTEKGDLQLWGRVVFLPTGNQGDTTGATLTMFTTSLASELSSVDDVGEKGETPVILESFRFKKN